MIMAVSAHILPGDPQGAEDACFLLHPAGAVHERRVFAPGMYDALHERGEGLHFLPGRT